jgi:hypothetical protein
MMLTYSFINLLAGSYRDDHNTGTADIGRKGNRSIVSLVGPASPVDTPSSPTSPGPPMTQVLQAVAEMTETKPPMPAPTGPTLRLSSQVVTASVEQYEPVQLRLIDTPGLNLSNDPVGSKARERGVAGLIRLLEERFEETLKEESRIIRTRKRQEDGMVHLGELWTSGLQLMTVIYLIDARAVLKPKNELNNDEDADWSCLGLFDQDKAASDALIPVRGGQEPGLDIVEITTVSF